MKKSLAYTSTAILLGFLIMILPRALEIEPSTRASQPLLPGFFGTKSTEAIDRNRTVPAAYALGSQPLNLLPSSFILFSGLIVALGVYVILKRRVV